MHKRGRVVLSDILVIFNWSSQLKFSWWTLTTLMYLEFGDEPNRPRWVGSQGYLKKVNSVFLKTKTYFANCKSYRIFDDKVWYYFSRIYNFGDDNFSLKITRWRNFWRSWGRKAQSILPCGRHYFAQICYILIFRACNVHFHQFHSHWGRGCYYYTKKWLI